MDVYLRIIGIAICILTSICGTILLVIFQNTENTVIFKKWKINISDILIFYAIGLFLGVFIFVFPETMETFRYAGRHISSRYY